MATSQPTDLRQLLDKVARSFRPDLVPAQLADVGRIAFEIALVIERMGTDVELCDIGSGVGLFPAACARLGMRVTMMDDFAHPFEDEQSARAAPDAPDAIYLGGVEDALALHRSLGVRVEQRDPLEEGFGFDAGSLDVVTIFDSMEHWHRSPRGLLREVMEALVPGGLLVIGVPNCVNLRKRLSVPLGRGKWSRMTDWYETKRFRGHVREPDVEDLRYIARDLGLAQVEILGRNWAGYASASPWIRRATAVADRLLQLRPSLCSDLYLIGRKPL
jgi:SAM-dependent methyltransferase